VAVSPLAEYPLKTLVHEVAHALLHGEGDETQRAMRECEAELVAYLVTATLGLPGLDESRGYVAAWRSRLAEGDAVNEKVDARIFAGANRILTAGRPSVARSEQ
jgi:hypothetical protein